MDAETPAPPNPWPAMILQATMATAVRVWHAHREHRAGRDPSAQETADSAREALQEAVEALAAACFRLTVSLDLASADLTSVDAARRFDQLLLLQDVGHMLHRVHQRLLSLYPDVSEALIESTRVLQQQALDLRDTAPESPQSLPRFLAASFDLLRTLKSAISLS